MACLNAIFDGFRGHTKKLQFPSFQWVSLPFSSFSFALRTADKVAASMPFPLQESFTLMISLR
jgi:hypothetical protein